MTDRANGRVRIVFILPALLGGGAERVCINFAKMIDADKYERVLLLLTESNERRFQVPEGLFDRLDTFPHQRTLHSVFSLRKYLKQNSPDIVFSTLIRSHVALYLAMMFAGIKTKTVLRSPNLPSSYLNSDDLNWVSRLVLSSAYKNADKVIAQTHEMKGELHALHQVPAERINVLRNPIDKSEIVRLSKEPSPLPEESFNIVSIGRITPQKGLDFLVESFPAVLAKRPNALLHIVGEDVIGLKASLETQAERLCVRSRIIFHGFKNNPYPYIANASVVVLASRWEGFPNVLLEAYALGVPIVTTNCAQGLTELIQTSVGAVVEFGDTIAMADQLSKVRERYLVDEIPGTNDFPDAIAKLSEETLSR